MNKSQLTTLFNYDHHTTRRMLDAAARLDEASLRADPGLGRRSLHELFFHLFNTNRSWRLALETGQQPAGLTRDPYPTLDNLRAGLAAEQAAWDALLARLTDAEIAGEVQLTTRRGDSWTEHRWRVLQHLLFHGMQHHTELAQLLTEQGQSVGDLDFIFYEG